MSELQQTFSPVDNRLLVVSPSLVYVVKDGNPSYIYACWLAASRQLVPLADIIERRCLKSGLLTAGDLDTSEITQQVRGYKVSSISAIRSSLEPLQAAWPFDVIPHGYQIKFVPRGKTPVATIDVLELGCVEGSQKPGVQITASREMDSQLPRKVLVSYLDVNREYDLNTGPGAERLNTDAVNVLQLELPIVMNADQVVASGRSPDSHARVSSGSNQLPANTRSSGRKRYRIEWVSCKRLMTPDAFSSMKRL